MARVPFVKMHGCGNDFIVIDALDGDLFDYAKHAARLNDRRFGIGCDQMLVIRPSQVADVQMRIFNNDGSEVEMCGNGIRCLLKYLVDHKRITAREATVETLGGIKKPVMDGDQVRADMGPPILDAEKIPTTLTGQIVSQPLDHMDPTLRFTAVSMGNPHAVFFLDDVARFPVIEVGPKIENHAWFPRRTNVEFARVVSREEIELRVWERGSGETLACGTGACATHVAAVLNNLTGHRTQIRLPGGTLTIEWDGDPTHSVFMTGPAEEVFSGVVSI